MDERIIKGMKEMKNKNLVQDLQSKRYTWEDLKIPDVMIQKGLHQLMYNKPSIIQSVAIP
jgi:hypothetical protein